MRLTQLRVKHKSLAAEARIIRLEEKRLKTRYKKVLNPMRTDDKGDATVDKVAVWRPKEVHQERRVSLWQHRTGVMRIEARSAYLAYGFLRGVPYRKIEEKVKPGNEPDWELVESIAQRFGGAATQVLGNLNYKDALQRWREAA